MTKPKHFKHISRVIDKRGVHHLDAIIKRKIENHFIMCN